jgi:hypothetical protein
MVELLICNQRVGGSNPSVGSNEFNELRNMLSNSFSFCCILAALRNKSNQ